MTATEKIYNYKKLDINKNSLENILSMDNEKIYGKIIYRYSMRQAINDNVLVDYNLIAPFFKENEEFIANLCMNKLYDTHTILTGRMIIMSLDKYEFKHMLIFSNTNYNAKLLKEFIEKYIHTINHKFKDNLKCIYLSGNDNMNKRKNEILKFEQSEMSIISSARIFGEGVDIKICDSICFANNKNSSIDIIQYVGRCLRKCKSLPNKLSYILVPFIIYNNDFFNYENQSYVKLRKILKTIGTTDDIITEKIELIDSNKYIEKYINKENVKINNNFNINEFTQNLLTKIFDRNGIIIDKTRIILINENKKRYENNIELLDTRKKCIKFLKSLDIEEPKNVNNWIKYSLGNKLFEIIVKNYCYNINEFKHICRKLNINNYDEYKIKYKNNKYLPSPDYINNGFYDDLKQIFNINDILYKKGTEFNF